MLSVRAATVADLDTVVAFRLALLQEAHDSPVYGRLRADAAQRARRVFQQQLASAFEVTLLAESDRVPIGILRCVESAGSPLLEPERYAYVSSVYVAPRARRSGVLHALLAQATTWCRDRGLGEMRLHSLADAGPANAAWDALGFTVVEHLRIRPVDRAADAALARPDAARSASPPPGVSSATAGRASGTAGDRRPAPAPRDVATPSLRTPSVRTSARRGSREDESRPER